MKVAKSYTGFPVSTNFRKSEISEEIKNFSKSLVLKLVLYLISMHSFHCYSYSNSSKLTNLKKSHFNYYQSDSLELPKSSLISNSELDTDKDGVKDILDLDDDNDGILDHHEGFINLHSVKNEGIIITMNGAWVLVFTSVYFELPSDLSHGDEFWIPFMGSEYVKAVRIKFENTENGIRFSQTAAKHTVGNDPDLDTNLDYDFDNGGIVAPIATGDNEEGYGIASIEYHDKVIISEYLGDSGKEWINEDLDTDNDGLINSRDTDSDNDGCPDALEGLDNLTTTSTLNNGSIGGSSDNLGTFSNNNGIPLPLGTLGGNETIGQSNSNESITSEQLIVSPLNNIAANIGDNLKIEVSATAMKTATFNIGVPNYTDVYGTNTSNLIEYKWYRKDDLNTIISTDKWLVFNDVQSIDSGSYIVRVKGSDNLCEVEKSVSITVDEVLGQIEGFNKQLNNFILYPNPTKGNIKILLSSKIDVEATIVLCDVSGKKIYSEVSKIMEGRNEINFNVKANPGVFFLKILSTEINYGVSKILIN